MSDTKSTLIDLLLSPDNKQQEQQTDSNPRDRALSYKFFISFIGILISLFISISYFGKYLKEHPAKPRIDHEAEYYKQKSKIDELNENLIRLQSQLNNCNDKRNSCNDDLNKCEKKSNLTKLITPFSTIITFVAPLLPEEAKKDLYGLFLKLYLISKEKFQEIIDDTEHYFAKDKHTADEKIKIVNKICEMLEGSASHLGDTSKQNYDQITESICQWSSIQSQPKQ